MKHFIFFLGMLIISSSLLFAEEGINHEEALGTEGEDKLEEEIEKSTFGPFLEDGKYLFTFPKRANKKGARWTSLFLLSTAAVIHFDEYIREAVQESRSSCADSAAGFFEPLGRAEINLVECGLFYFAARLLDDDYLKDTSILALESLIYTGLITSVSKVMFGREGPSSLQRWGSFFNRDDLFPSGHTSRSFAMATVLAERYKKKYMYLPYLAYSIAFLIGFSTVVEDTHWLSDVFAGAALGFLIGKSIVNLQEERETKIHASILPLFNLNHEEVGFSLHLRF